MTRHYRSACIRLLCFTVALIGIVAGAAPPQTVWLSSLDLSKALLTDMVQPTIDKTIDGKTLTIKKQSYDRGVCLNGYTVLYVRLDGGCDSFSAVAGIDDESMPSAPPAGGAAGQTGRGGRGARGRGASSPPSMSLRILADGNRILYESEPIPAGSSGVPVQVDTKGVQLMAIIVNSAGGGRRGASAPVPHYDLAEAKFEVSGAQLRTVEVSGMAREVLTPKAGPEPRINGPALTGVSPGRPVLYKIPATGAKPITYSVDGLPARLTVDPATGIITGTIKNKGTYPVTLRARNSAG